MAARAPSTASMAGADQVKIDWNSRYMMAKNASPPVRELRKKLSRRVWERIRMSPLGPNRRASWWAVPRSSTSGESTRRDRGTRVAPPALARNWLTTASRPLPLRADTGNTGVSSSAASPATSSASLWLSSTSIILASTVTGLPWRSQSRMTCRVK